MGWFDFFNHTSSTTSSVQKAESNIMQKFSGSCDIKCQNRISDVNIDLIDSVIGGSVLLSQTCAANGSCIIGNTMTGIVDTMFKAQGSTNAHDTGSIVGAGNSETANSSSYQDLYQSVQNYSTQTCNVGSYNEMDNINIFADNTQIVGDIAVSQSGSTVGKCQLTNNMSAASKAAVTADLTASSGKDKKASKFSSAGSFLIFAVVIIVGIIAFMVIAKSLGSNVKDIATSPAGQELLKQAPMLLAA